MTSATEGNGHMGTETSDSTVSDSPSDKVLSRGWVTFTDASINYRASCIGGCIASLTAARLGEPEYPPSATLQKAMDRSSAGEDLVLAEVSSRLGGNLMWQQHEVTLPTGLFSPDNKPILITGHIDALRQKSDDIIEVKFLGEANFAKYNKSHGNVVASLHNLGSLGLKYIWQGAAYGHGLGRQIRYVIGCKKVDKETGEVTLQDLIIEPPIDAESLVPLAEIIERIKDVEQYAEQDAIPDCDRGCTEYDGYGHCHLFESPIRGDDDLRVLIERDRELDALLTELKNEKDQLRDAIKLAYQPGKYTVGPYTLHLITKNPKRFDSKAFKAANPDLYEEWSKPGVPYVEMRVTGGSSTKEAASE